MNVVNLQPNEIIKDVKGFEGRFMVTSHGRLFSINGRYRGVKELKPHTDCLGYKAIQLRMTPKNRRDRLHAIVAETFLKKEDWHTCVNHKDGNKINNHVDNLEWTNGDGNIKHAVATGLMDLKGEKHHNSKLTKEKVIEMRKMRSEQGLAYSEIGKMFGVCRRQASDVVRGVNWGWL